MYSQVSHSLYKQMRRLINSITALRNEIFGELSVATVTHPLLFHVFCRYFVFSFVKIWMQGRERDNKVEMNYYTQCVHSSHNDAEVTWHLPD